MTVIIFFNKRRNIAEIINENFIKYFTILLPFYKFYVLYMFENNQYIIRVFVDNF